MRTAKTLTPKRVLSLSTFLVLIVQCICSIERLYCQLKKSGQPALEPIYVTTSGGMLLFSAYQQSSLVEFLCYSS